MTETIFSHGQGEGIILEHGETLAHFFTVDTADVVLGDSVLQFGQPTTLNGWFNCPIEYCGKIKNNILVFLLGADDGDLFTHPKSYYETMLYLTPTRFYRNYSHKGGRDFNYVNGKWK